MRRHLIVWALLWAAFVIYGSFVPFAYRPLDGGIAIANFRQAIAQPISARLRSDFAANVLLFIPLGFLWLGAASANAPRARAAFLAAPVWAACIALSIVVEFTQVWFPPRTPSINDIVGESIGAFLGCGMWVLIGMSLMVRLESLIYERPQEARVRGLLLAYCVVFAAYSVMPLDLTISLHEIYRKYRDGKILIVPFAYKYDSAFDFAFSSLRDVLVMVPVGAYSSICLLPESRGVRGIGMSIALGMAYVLILEAVQVLVMSRYSDATDLVTGLVGVAIGSSIMQFRLGASRAAEPRPVRSTSCANIWLTAAACFAVLSVFGYWYPFNFNADAATRVRLESFVSVPLTAIWWGSEFNAVSQVFLKISPFAIIGACLSMAILQKTKTRSERNIYRFVAWVACGGLGFVVELGQLFLPEHVADVTDVLLYGVGSLVGIAIVSWLKDGVDLSDRRWRVR